MSDGSSAPSRTWSRAGSSAGSSLASSPTSNEASSPLSIPTRSEALSAADLSAHRLSVDLGGRRVLDGIDLALGVGWTAIIGPNGAGKSTLLRSLAGLLPPAVGEVRLHGQPLARHPPRDRARAMAWLAQHGELEGDLSVLDTVQLGRLPHLGLLGQPGADDQAAVLDAMATTGCSEWAHRRLAELSGGERQRVLMARVLATGARILLLDEPTTHLDPPHQVAVADLIRQLAVDHAVVTVLHDLPIAIHADRLVLMRQGRLIGDGAPTEAAVQQAIVDLFDGAVAIESRGAGLRVVPAVGRPAAAPQRL
jgi:iron complex transport system ATP-binding protein